MFSISHLEKAISIASQIKDCLLEMSRCYAILPDVIRREHLAIRKSDLIDVEGVAAEKLKMAEQIECHYHSLQRLAKDLGMIATDMMPELVKTPQTVSECIDIMEALSESCQKKGFGAQVFEHVLSGIRLAFAELSNLKIKSEPVIEQNRDILQRIMLARQENLRFWQEISAAVLAPYDGQGKKRKNTASSYLNVKA